MKSDLSRDVNLTAIGSLLQASLDTTTPLGEETAADIITQLERVPYDPEQISEITREIQRAPSFWTSAALQTLQKFFDIAHLPKGTGTQMFWGRGTNRKTPLKINAPSIKEITDGSVEGGQVKAVLTQIYRDRFASSLHDMASIVRMSERNLAKIITGNSPLSLGEVMRIAVDLEVQQGAFINSWIADKFNQSINWQSINREGQAEPVSRRFLNLVYAADLMATDGKMDSISRISMNIASKNIDMPQIAAYADMALHAGFEPSLVSDVVTDYIQSFDIRDKEGRVSNKLLDNYFEGFEDLMSNRYPRLATISSQLASLYWQKRGETGLAAIAEYNASQGMVHASWKGNDFENLLELSDPTKWERGAMEQAFDFLNRSAELTAQYELEERITMSGPVVEERLWRLSFIEAILAGDKKGALSIVIDDKDSAERISGVQLDADEVSDAWQAISDRDILWESGFLTPPIVVIKGKGYLIPPDSKQSEVYFDRASRTYKKIWQSPSGGSSSSFAGFLNTTELYLKGLPSNSRFVVDRFRKTYPNLWGSMIEDRHIDLVDQALQAFGKKDEIIPGAAFAIKLTSLMTEAGYLPDDEETTSHIEKQYDLDGATHVTFGGQKVPINALGSAIKPVLGK